MKIPLSWSLVLSGTLVMAMSPLAYAENEKLILNLRSRLKAGDEVVEKTERWQAKKTVLIVCDMWDDHWCRSASRRVEEMAGALNETIKAAREKGIFIIHAPSSVTDLIVEHVEKYWCPSFTSADITGKKAFRFAEDVRGQ